MHPASDAEYSPATGVVIAQRRLILSVELEFPGSFPDIAGGEYLGQTEAEYNGRDPKQPCIHRHGEPQRVSANILAQSRSDDRRQDARVKHSIPLSCRFPLLAQSGH